APFVGRLFDRVGPRPLVVPGSVVVACALGMMTLLSAASPTWHAVAAHVALSVGLGLLMTPLMTSALGSVEPRLYSHGSAIMNTLQQLAGGAGTALFITVMTTRTAARVADGVGAAEARAGGIHDAFLCGAGLAVVAVAFSFFVRKPTTADAAQPAPASAH
ncbi:MFS transporter, partial [Georgenia sp. 10Sc9-8]|nr:MFS transporter [Georgenia halotolerans]